MRSLDKKSLSFSQTDPLKPNIVIPRKPAPKPKTEKPLLQKRGGMGASRNELRVALRKMPYDSSIKMMKEERIKEEKKLFSPYAKYKEYISETDNNNRLKLLTKEKAKTPHYADKLKIQHEINLLRKLKELKEK